MSSGKFIPAIAQKTSAQTQKIKQQQLKSTYRYFQNRNSKSQIPDMFVKQDDKNQPISKSSILEAVTERLKQFEAHK